MKLETAEILYTIKLLIGPNKGNTVTFIIDLEYLDENDISDYLIENDHLTECGHPCDAYDMIERKFITIDSAL